MTLFANYPIHLSIVLLASAALILATRSARPPRDPLLPPPTLLSPTRSRPSSPSSGQSRQGSFPSTAPISTSANSVNDEPANSPIVSLMTGYVPYITTYRSHMMLMTILAILAVDFPVFPRYLVKCESFGVSLMDLGVGSFVFSQGLVSAIPVLKNPRSLEAPLFPKIVQVTRKVMPLLALGLVRVILVKGTEYPEHITEYGVHWNFFITMAILPPLSVLLHPMILKLPISLLGMIISIAHECLLCTTSLQSWALGDSREGIISQNKEGIVSLPGYLAIHILGLLTGTLLLPPSPSMFRRYYRRGGSTARAPSNTKRKPGKAAIELTSYSSVWWILFSIVSFFKKGPGSPVSRRLANLPYVLWIAAFNTSFLLAYVLIDTHFFHPRSPPTFPYVSHVSAQPRTDSAVPESNGVGNSIRPSLVAALPSEELGRSSGMNLSPWSSGKSTKRTYSTIAHEGVSSETHSAYREREAEDRRAPELLEAINLNGLALFLLANVMTGLVNLSFSTMYASGMMAMGILLGYSGLICTVAWACRGTRLWQI